MPRLTPDRSVRTSTSSGPGSGNSTGRISPWPGSRIQNARASVGTPTLLSARTNRSVAPTVGLFVRRYGGTVRRVQGPVRSSVPPAPFAGFVGLIGLLALLSVTTGLGASGVGGRCHVRRRAGRPAGSRDGPCMAASGWDRRTGSRSFAPSSCVGSRRSRRTPSAPARLQGSSWRCRRWRFCSTGWTARWPGAQGPRRHSGRASTSRSTPS